MGTFTQSCLTVRFALVAAMVLSAIALGLALIAQLLFGMEPCQMCIYQRIPFVVIIVLGALGLANRRLQNSTLCGIGIAALANAGIAFYHSGIERRWWDETEGCKVSFDFADTQSTTSLFDQITSAQVDSCASGVWYDPVLSLSMANYNIVLCGALALYALGAVVLRRR